MPDLVGQRTRARARIAVLIPVHNEAQSITKVVSDFKAIDPDVPVYVFDNNSTDDSAKLAADAGAIVVPEYRQGKGFVIRSMFRHVDADSYVMVDGDDTYPADEAYALSSYVLSGRADMVIGDRLSSTYFAENQRRFHGFGNRLVRTLVNRMFNSNTKDIMTGCRAFGRTFVKAFPVMSAGFEIETEMTIHALDKNFSLVEVPITYRNRAEGSASKVNTVSDGLRVLRTVFALFRDYRPMQFFGIIAAVLFLASAAFFWVPLREYLLTGYVSKVPTLVVSIALGLSAMLALMCGVLLDSIRTHSRQFYELALTANRETEELRRACDSS